MTVPSQPISGFSRLEQALQEFHDRIQAGMPGYLVERDRTEPYTAGPGPGISVNAGDATCNAQEGQQVSTCRLRWFQSVEVIIYAPRDGMPAVGGTPRSMVSSTDAMVAQIYRAAMQDRTLGGLCSDITPGGRGLRPTGKGATDIYVGLIFSLEIFTRYDDLTLI